MQRHPLIFFHLVTAVGALLLGIVMLSRRKGTTSHRALGWIWVVLMGSTALASAFIRDYRLPNLYGYTPIHGFTLFGGGAAAAGHLVHPPRQRAGPSQDHDRRCTSAPASWPACSRCCPGAFSAACCGARR